MSGLAWVRRCRSSCPSGHAPRCRPAGGRGLRLRGPQSDRGTGRRTGSTTHGQARRPALPHEYGTHRQRPVDARPAQEGRAKAEVELTRVVGSKCRGTRPFHRGGRARFARRCPRREPPLDEVTRLKMTFRRFERAVQTASEPARQIFLEQCRDEIMALTQAAEPPVGDEAVSAALARAKA
jgi:hypothetical protein